MGHNVMPQFVQKIIRPFGFLTNKISSPHNKVPLTLKRTRADMNYVEATIYKARRKVGLLLHYRDSAMATEKTFYTIAFLLVLLFRSFCIAFSNADVEITGRLAS